MGIIGSLEVYLHPLVNGKRDWHKRISCNKGILKVTLSFTPYPLSGWYPAK
jgi:hypothetical protein